MSLSVRHYPLQYVFDTSLVYFNLHPDAYSHRNTIFQVSLANLPPNKLIVFSLHLVFQVALSIYLIFLIARYFQEGREREEKRGRWKGRERRGSICYALHIDLMCIDI